MREFSEYVRSPFFNKNQSIIKLFDYIKKQYPAFDSKKIEKELVYKKLFPGTEYNDGFMRTIMFNLAQLAEDFLSYSNYKKDYFSVQRHLAVELNERELYKLFEKNMREVHTALEKDSVKESEHYYNSYYFEYENLYYLSKIHFERNEKFIQKTGIHEIFNHLTYYYVIRILKFYLYVLNTKNIYKIDYKTDIIEDILKGIKPEQFKNIPLINIYINLLMMHINPGEESHFNKAVEMIETADISYDELIEAFINIENYCKTKIRLGHVEYEKILFKIYKIELDRNCYLLNNRMPHKLYRNIIDLALRLDEPDWTKDFIEKHNKELDAEFQENSYLYSTALLEFYKKNFEKSLEILSRVRYDEIYHKLEIKCFTAAIYYELNHEDSLLSSLDSFRHFINNDKLIPEARKESYTNFIKVVKKMNNLKNSNKRDIIEVKILADKVKKTEQVQNRQWIEKKVQELLV
jgi:hypothetical protein